MSTTPHAGGDSRHSQLPPLLRQAVTAYDRAVGSFGSRLVPMARRLEEMRVTETARRTLAAPAPVDVLPRARTP